MSGEPLPTKQNHMGAGVLERPSYVNHELIDVLLNSCKEKYSSDLVLGKQTQKFLTSIVLFKKDFKKLLFKKTIDSWPE